MQQLAIVSSLLLPVVLGLIPERPIDDKSGATVHRAWTDSVSASDIRHALAWVHFFSFLHHEISDLQGLSQTDRMRL